MFSNVVLSRIGLDQSVRSSPLNLHERLICIYCIQPTGSGQFLASIASLGLGIIGERGSSSCSTLLASLIVKVLRRKISQWKIMYTCILLSGIHFQPVVKVAIDNRFDI